MRVEKVERPSLRVLGIDPGLSGAVAILDINTNAVHVLSVIDIPTHGEKAKRRVDAINLIDWLEQHMPIDIAFIERAGSMPKQGIASAFNYGRAVGCIECAVQGMRIPLTHVESTKWKKALGLKGSDKENSRQRVLMTFPAAAKHFARKLDHNRAEAVLIAEFGRLSL